MSYTCSFHCFDPEVADEKWTTDDPATVRNYTDEDLMSHDLWLGSVVTLCDIPDLYQDVEELLLVHGIQINEYPTRQNVEALLKSIDKVKVRSILESHSSKYEPEIRAGFNATLQIIKPFIEGEDSPETTYSIEGLEKYLVPLLKTCGILAYSTVTKGQFVEFHSKFDTDKYEQCVHTLLTSYDENVRQHESDLIEILTTFKQMLQTLGEKPSCTFVFSDDGDIHPSTVFEERLPRIKERLRM